MRCARLIGVGPRRPYLLALLGLALTLVARGATAHGRSVASEAPRPAGAVRQLCSLRWNACVHTAGPVERTAPARALAAAELALSAYAALGLPSPLDDDRRGGSDALDLYLAPGAAAGVAFADGIDELAAHDRAPAFVVLAPPERGCAFESHTARAVAQAIVLGIDAAVGDGLLALQSSYLATLAAPCPTLEAEAVDRFQRNPERALTSHPRTELAGGWLFPAFLDDAYGKDEPIGLSQALLAISAQRSASPTNAFLDDEPDALDTLRRLLQAQGKELSDALLDFAVARAFLGDRSDGSQPLGLEQLGAWARPRFEWSVARSSLPRRFAPRSPIEPSGASYLWIDLEGRSEGLAIDAAWEESFVFAWTAVKIDAQGRVLSRYDQRGLWGRAEAHLSLADLSGAAAVLVVTTQEGNDDRAHPFDPDEGEPLAAGYEITIRPL